MWEPDFARRLKAPFCPSVNAISPHLFSTFCCPSQAHGSGRPEELHLLAESEPRCHCVCRAGLRYVQSTSQTAVMGRPRTAPSGDAAPSLLTRKTKNLVDPSWPRPLFPYNTKKMLRKTILYALKQQCFGYFMRKEVDFNVSQSFFQMLAFGCRQLMKLFFSGQSLFI